MVIPFRPNGGHLVFVNCDLLRGAYNSNSKAEVGSWSVVPTILPHLERRVRATTGTPKV